MTPIFYYWIVISMIRCNFLQSLKKFCGGGSEPPQIFENLRWLWTPRQNFLNFAKSCILSCWLQFDNKKWGSPSSFLSYKRLKLKLRVFLASHICCYGNLLCHKINSKLFPDDWAVCWYHDFGVNRYSMVIMTHQTLSLKKCWKL